MANNFRIKTKSGIGTSSETIYTVGSGITSIVIGLLVANVHASATAKCTVTVTTAATSGESADNPRLASLIPIPHGASLELAEGKYVMTAGDSIAVLSDTAASLDVTLSVLEQN